jgi:hypothetical protein
MVSWLPKLSPVSRALFGGGLLVLAALAPVAAQQPVAPPDGQVAVRSDGAVYLIANGQRRWVATVAITDDELNAYPEGEPIYGGLAPLGEPAGTGSPSTTNTVFTSASPTTSSSSAGSGSRGSSSTGSSSTGSSSTGSSSSSPSSASAGPTEVATPTGATGEIDPQVPIEVDVDGTPKREPGERFTVNLKTKTGTSCELTVKWPDGKEANQEKKTADSRGRCQYSISIPNDAATGTGLLKGVASAGGRTSHQEVEFEIIPSS